MTARKRTITLLGISLFLSIGGCSNISIRTSVEIAAPKESVYSVLADLKSYPEWNPYHREITGSFKEGAALKVLISRPDGQEVNVPPHMLRIVDNKEITWGGGVRGIFYGEHSFLLEQLSHNSTRLMHQEDFSGIAVGFADLPPDVIAEGYHLMNMALKKRVEDLYQQKVRHD